MNTAYTKTSNSSIVSESALSDEELLLRYRTTNDPEIFAQLVQRYERELFSYLRRYLGTAEMAEDVFQAAFLQVHLKCDQFEEGRRFRPWLYTIATNQAIDAQRRNRRHRMVSIDQTGDRNDEEVGRLANLLESNDSNPLEKVSEFESAAWVQKALDELSDQMRNVVTLVYYQGLKYRKLWVSQWGL